MIVLVTERVAPGVRGEIRRWLLEVRSGVFVGKLSARVRDELWQHVVAKRRTGAVVMIFTQRNEQGYSIRVEGDPSRQVVDLDGLALTVVHPVPAAAKSGSRKSR